MAQFSMGVRIVKRSEGQSIMAAAAYRAGEKLWDERQGMFHDFRHKSIGVEHAELLFPDDAPGWVKGVSRETFWNAVDANERRKDAQTARDLRVMIPREIPPDQREPLVRDFVRRNFVRRGMAADLCFHNYVTVSDGGEQPHAHILLAQRPLTTDGFGPKSRHEWVPDSTGQKHPDGRPVMVESNPDSWNSNLFYEKCREDWEKTANAALERVGSSARIDRRSLLERGLARIPEPALRLAFHLKELRGVMRQRFGQFQYAKHYQAVEQRAKSAFRTDDAPADKTSVGGIFGHGRHPAEPPTRLWDRFHSWIDRQLERLAVAGPTLPPADHPLGAARSERAPPRDNQTQGLER